MTVKEYNKEFLPKIKNAEMFVALFESCINHAMISDESKAEVLRQFRVHTDWGDEIKQTILSALNYHKNHVKADLERPERHRAQED